MTNRLIRSASPYLLQHAGNPVDWFPWGEEAFAKARQEDKPIFLSVGYSTCHWCHVMAHESFENEEVARLLNENFVAIKIDREERPDVDQIYMSFVQASTGHGGWPMSVWLTPDLKPFYGGTYYPPSQFARLLEGIARAWTQQRADIARSGDDIVSKLRHATEVGGGGELVGADAIERAVDSFRSDFDEEHAGFGAAPKFPRPAVFELLLPYAAWHRNGRGDEALRMSVATLRMMASGGMYDALGGGFHRYSVDARWHVPHFEKMLYDQAQLVGACCRAALLFDDAELRRVIRETCDYVLRDLGHADGGFYAAEDADSRIAPESEEHAEGAFYVWTTAEIRAVLDPASAEAFIEQYQVQEGGNVDPGADPHNELRGKNVLHARDLSLDDGLARARAALFAHRASRPRPHRDDKILCAWNGLMIGALAQAALTLDEPRYAESAARAARFLQAEIWDAHERVLHRVWRDGRGATRGFADDYAFLIQGLLELHQADLDAGWLRWAVELQAAMDRRFWDADAGGWFDTEAEQADLLLRLKEQYDGAEPAPSSVATLNCLRLAQLLGEESYRERAGAALRAFAVVLERGPQIAPLLSAALLRWHQPQRIVVIVGERGAAETEALLAVLRNRYLPGTEALLLDGRASWLVEGRPWLAAMRATDGRATAYLCEGRSCRAPTAEAAELAAQLESYAP